MKTINTTEIKRKKTPLITGKARRRLNDAIVISIGCLLELAVVCVLCGIML